MAADRHVRVFPEAMDKFVNVLVMDFEMQNYFKIPILPIARAIL